MKQAQGDLLPRVTASINTNANNRNYITRQDAVPPARDDYNSNGSQLTVTTPLWRWSSVVALKQAGAAISQAEHQLRAAEADLLIRLVTAWCDVMAARDGVVLASSGVAYANEQLVIQRRGAAVGVAALPAVEEAQGKYELALSDSVAAEAELQLKIAALEQIIGPFSEFGIPFLVSDVQSISLDKKSLDQWITEAERSSPAVHAAESALEAATREVEKQRAGHQPTVDLVATYGRNGQSAGTFPGQNGFDTSQRAVGIQINIPLYSGGTQSGKVDEAIAMQEKARHDLEAARRAARLNTKQAWFGWHSARSRQLAARQTASAALLGMKVADTGNMNGLKTAADLLQAKQQFLTARRDFSKAGYDMAVSFAKLKAATGQLDEEDIHLLNSRMVAAEPDFQEAVFSPESEIKGAAMARPNTQLTSNPERHEQR